MNKTAWIIVGVVAAVVVCACPLASILAWLFL